MWCIIVSIPDLCPIFYFGILHLVLFCQVMQLKRNEIDKISWVLWGFFVVDEARFFLLVDY